MASLREMDATCNVQCRQFTMQPRTCTYIHNYIHRLDFHGSCCVELVLNCNGRSSTRQVQWSFYKGDFLGAYVHSRTHGGMRGHGFAPAHQGLLLVGHPKTSPRILSESLRVYYHHPTQIPPNDQPLLYTNTSEKLVYIHT